MTTTTTPESASQDESQQDAATQDQEQDIDALFAEAAAKREGATSEPAQEEPTGDEPKVDLPENAVKEDVTPSGDADVEGAKPKTEATTEGEAPSKPKEEKPADANAWRAALPPEAQKYLRDLEHKARSDAGRVSGLTKKIEELSKRDRAEAEAKAKARAEQMAAFKEKYPEIAEAIEASVTGVQEEVAGTKQLVTELAADVAPTVEADRYEAVEQAHKGWRATIAQPAFAEWLELQTPGVKSLSYSDEPGDAIALLDLYREKHPAPSDEPKGDEPTPTPPTQAKPASKTAAEVKAARDKKLADSVGIASSKAVSRESTTTPSAGELEGAFDYFAAKKEAERKAQQVAGRR